VQVVVELLGGIEPARSLILAAMDHGKHVVTANKALLATHWEELVTRAEQKRVALGYLQEAWAEARLDGVDGDCLAQACLFAALAEFVTTYGEEPAARFTEGLATRIRNGEFTISGIKHQ